MEYKRRIWMFGVLLWAIAIVVTIDHAYAADRKRRMEVPVFSAKDEMLAWMAYGIGLDTWILKTGAAKVAPEGPYLPPFEAEIAAREFQIKVWQESIAKKSMDLPYMDTMLKVASANFLKEYIWYYHRTSSWGVIPADLHMDEFDQWRKKELADHLPQTKVKIVFGAKEDSGQ